MIVTTLFLLRARRSSECLELDMEFSMVSKIFFAPEEIHKFSEAIWVIDWLFLFHYTLVIDFFLTNSSSIFMSHPR